MEMNDSDAHLYSKEGTIQEYLADLEEVSDTESVKSVAGKSENTESSNKMKKLLNKPKDDGYFKYNIMKGKKIIKIECYGTGTNTGNLIRCPYSGIRSNDRVGSSDEINYFRAHMPCITKGDNHMYFYYDTPEAFERHHLTILSKEIKDRWYALRK